MMARHATEEERTRVKIQAAMRGIDVDKVEKEKKLGESLKFKDPAEYEDMTPEEREELTQRMMARYRGMRIG